MRMEPENNILSIVKGFSDSSVKMKLKIIGPTTDFFDKNCKPIIKDSQTLNILDLYMIERSSFMREQMHLYIFMATL